MKTKLLKKIRKQYEIRYFKSGEPVFGLGKFSQDFYHLSCEKSLLDTFYDTKEQCIDRLMKDVRERFGKVKTVNNEGIKVWHK